MSLNISFNKIPTNKTETILPEKTEGFLFLSITDINSFIFLGGTSIENYGLYIFDLNKNSWSNPKLNGELPPPSTYIAGWYDSPYLFIHGGKSLLENKSQNETYLIDIITFTSYKVFTMEQPSSRYGHSAIHNNDKQAYIFGGCNIGKKTDRFLSDLHKLEYKSITIVDNDNNSNNNVNGASWITNIATKGEKPSGRIFYGMVYLDKNNCILLYGGMVKGNLINDNIFYLFNIDEKEWKKFNINNCDLGCRCNFLMIVNTNCDFVYILGGKMSNGDISDKIYRINVDDGNCIEYNGKDENLMGKRYLMNGCAIVEGIHLMSHIIIFGGKKNENEFWDYDIIDIAINDEKNDNLKNDNHNINEKNLNSNSGRKNGIPISSREINPTLEIMKQKDKCVEELINKQNKFITDFNNYVDVNKEYNKNKYELMKLKKEIKEREIEISLNKMIINDKGNLIEENKNSISNLNKQILELRQYNEVLEKYLNLYKERFCLCSQFIIEYLIDINKMDEIILKNEFQIPDINYEELINSRNKYKNFVANLKNEFKMYTQNEREIYNKIVKLSSKNQMINKEQTLSFRERDSLEFGY